MEIKQKQKTAFNQQIKSQLTERLEIIYYTDPLCCWSWGFEPQWRRFIYEFSGQIKFRYCMGGLLPSWKNYNDSVNSVSKPIQMGPVWMHAGQLTGMPIEHNAWMRDPPASSYPACIAVKCAALQSLKAEDAYLRLLREAVMVRAENISRQNVLLDLATRLITIVPGFDIQKFKEDLGNDNGLEAFRKDLQETQYHNINRFPSLIVKNTNNQAVIIAGYRPYEHLLSAIKPLGELKQGDEIDAEEYKRYWPSITERELAEVN